MTWHGSLVLNIFESEGLIEALFRKQICGEKYLLAMGL
jgi:hypothetical protein